jgi:hypothetical protein
MLTRCAAATVASGEHAVDRGSRRYPQVLSERDLGAVEPVAS